MTSTIQQMAVASGLSSYTLRYYEQIGLIDPIPRSSSGHRQYRESDARWIEFLLRLRATGMPVQQMLHYAELRRAGNHLESVAERKAMLVQHTQTLEQALAELQNNLALMRQKIAAYAELESNLAAAAIQEEALYDNVSTRLEPLAAG